MADAGVPGKAAALTWGAPTSIRRCEWHLTRQLVTALPEAVQRDPSDPLHPLVGAAVRSIARWERFSAAAAERAAAGGNLKLQNAMVKVEPVVRAQAPTRTAAQPHSTGPLEEYFHVLDRTIGDRAGQMTNKHRADALLMLLAAHRNGWVNEARWAELIRKHLLARKGHAREQRQHADRANKPSLR